MVLPETTKGAGPCLPDSASLDRLDSTIGYRQGNLRWVSYMANIARNRFDDETLRRFARAVVDYA